MGEPKKRSAAKDLSFGILLIAFSIYVIISSFGMKFFKSFIDGAGFFPLIIGCVLLIMGAVLALIGLRAGGIKELKEVVNASFLKKFISDEGTIRVVILLAMMIIYMYVLIDLIGFLYSTPIYLFANFMYLKACKKLGPIPGWVMAIIISVLVSVVTYYAFKYGLGVTLP